MSPSSKHPLRRIIGEIHRRSIWQVLLIYLVASWIVFEVVQTLTEGLGLPGWFPPFAFVLLLIGLPIVLATSFVQEDAPGRISARSPADLDEIIPAEEATADNRFTGFRALFTWRNAILGGVGAFALWGLLAAGWLILGPGSGASRADEGRAFIAVLPFENLSPDPDNGYFADGVHDEILTHLAKVGGLNVISRTSVMEYRDPARNLREIANELGVSTVLEGSVRKAGDRVRVTAQLIDAHNDRHLWADTYDRRLTIHNLLDIQTNVAEAIAAALEAQLAPEERRLIEERPTNDLEAYDFFLRGNEYFIRGRTTEDWNNAIRLYEKAVELDPEFAVAYARLSVVHANLYWYYFDKRDERLADAQRAAERAMELGPNLPEPHLATGWSHYARRDYERALRELRTARELSPNNPDVVELIGEVLRRSGDWDGAVEAFSRAAELDPRSSLRAMEVGLTQYLMGHYPEGRAQLERAIELAPDRFLPYSWKARLQVSLQGDSEDAHLVLAEGLRNSGAGPRFAGRHPWWWLFRIGPGGPELLQRLSPGSFPTDSSSYYLTWAHLLDREGRAEQARAYYDSARVVLQGKLEALPREPRFHGELGIAYAGLGRRGDAIAEGKAAVALLPVHADALDGPNGKWRLAVIYTMLREDEAALDEIQALLSAPGWVSVPLLRVDPMWDGLRDHPRFQALLEESR